MYYKWLETSQDERIQPQINADDADQKRSQSVVCAGLIYVPL